MATHFSILAWRNPMDRGASQATVPGVTKSRIQLSTHAHCVNSWGETPGSLCLASSRLPPCPFPVLILSSSVAINHSHEYVCMSCVSSWGTSESGGGLGSPRYNNCTKVNFLLLINVL